MTKREAQISRHILLGWPYSRIAKEFELNLPTVKKHVSNIYNKVGCSTHVEFVSMVLNSADFLNQIYGV